MFVAIRRVCMSVSESEVITHDILLVELTYASISTGTSECSLHCVWTHQLLGSTSQLSRAGSMLRVVQGTCDDIDETKLD